MSSKASSGLVVVDDDRARIVSGEPLVSLGAR